MGSGKKWWGQETESVECLNCVDCCVIGCSGIPPAGDDWSVTVRLT